MNANTIIVVRPSIYETAMNVANIKLIVIVPSELEKTAMADSKPSKAGMPVVVAAQMRQASCSFKVGNGEFQARQWMAPNPHAKSPKRSTGTVLAAHPGAY